MDAPTERELWVRVWTTLLTLTGVLLLQALTDPKLPHPIRVILSYLW